MKNTIKLLSHNKDYRIVLTNTSDLAVTKLKEFKGVNSTKRFLTEVITNSILFSGMNDFLSKTSFNFKISKELTAYCIIENGNMRLDWSSPFEDIPKISERNFTLQSTLSITIGDFTGLHTSTVLAPNSDVTDILNFFTKQSDQLPAKFVLNTTTPSIGAVIQPLPFANIDTIKKAKDTLADRINKINTDNWNDTAALLCDIGKLLWERQVE